MTKGVRLTVFIIFVLLVTGIFIQFGNQMISYNQNIKVLIFSSALMLAFGTLVLEHYFTKPTDVLSSAISILLAITPLQQDLSPGMGAWYWVLIAWVASLAILSLASLALFDPDAPPHLRRNIISRLLKDFTTRFGSSKSQYFLLLILSMLFYVDGKSELFLALFFYSCFALLDPWKFILKSVANRKDEISQLGLGQVVGVQSKNTFLVKLFSDRPSVKIFDPVEFKIKSDQAGRSLRGLVLDNYVLNEEQWVKVLVSLDIAKELEQTSELKDKIENIVYKIEAKTASNFLKTFVGVVAENSNIRRIRFIYNSKIDIFEGQLLEARVDGKIVLYQIVQGITKIEKLENKNETGFIVGEAVQLGVWNDAKCTFEKYGWLPEINSPLFLANRIAEPQIKPEELLVGNIPETNYPVIMNKNIAITHHLAVLGVTGTGKSVFSRNLVREYIKDGTKVICVDFTGEYSKNLSDLNPESVISPIDSKTLFQHIDWKQTEYEKFANQQDKNKITQTEQAISALFKKNIEAFLKDGQKNISLFELPDVVNTSGIFDYTKCFFKSLFEIAKNDKSFGKRVCVVLEEAHTIIPEWNFAGSADKTSQSLVNSIGQIALQGRKYDIGFLIIAQRTANVSKTVLTQCNSIVAFQEFDKTSSDFLSNYLGSEIAATLPNLQFRQAIAVGKAFKSNVPMIFEVPEIDEIKVVERLANEQAAQAPQ
jgi:hypothetical protein